MTIRSITTTAAIMACILALAMFCLSQCEPVAQEVPQEVRVDTVLHPYQTPASAWIDSVARVDSLKAERGLTTSDSAFLRRGRRSLQEIDSLSREGLKRIKND
ncbi:MAG: hypothetical protein IMZ53_09575 [Thermoplasmata archaeon]|nr:hypothetical protein [Thermoplasmata archaeon]